MRAGAKLVFTKLGALQGAADEISDRALRAIALAIQEEAQNEAPRDTSAMANSIYTETAGESGRAAALDAARRSNPGVRAASEVPVAPGQAKVAVGVEYGAYVELGTKRMGAKPYLAPAVQRIEAEAEQIAGRVVAEEIKRRTS